MINFRKYSENNNTYFIFPRDLDPESFPIDLHGPVKCGISEPGKELIRLYQDFPPKKRRFVDLGEFHGDDSLNNGIWAYFRDKRKMDDFLNSHIPFLIKEYEQLQGVVPFKLLKTRVFIP